MEAMEIVRGSAKRRGANMYIVQQLEQRIIELENRVQKLEKAKTRAKKEE